MAKQRQGYVLVLSLTAAMTAMRGVSRGLFYVLGTQEDAVRPLDVGAALKKL